MLPTFQLIDQLAMRIETAYRLRDRAGYTDARRRDFGAVPLRVFGRHTARSRRNTFGRRIVCGMQTISSPFSDPWAELGTTESSLRYRSTINEIVGRLAAELKREVDTAERCIRKGNGIGAVLSRESQIVFVGLIHRRAASGSRRPSGAVRQGGGRPTPFLPTLSCGKHDLNFA